MLGSLLVRQVFLGCCILCLEYLDFFILMYFILLFIFNFVQLFVYCNFGQGHYLSTGPGQFSVKKKH